MGRQDTNIVFFGTPSFAVPSLRLLLGSGFRIAAVVTAPDKPAGRGMQMQAPPIKSFALENDLRILQPVSMRDPLFLETLSSLRPDLQVVVAFRKLPHEVWAPPPFGTFNLHASLLPWYRGAAPINWALINGESRTGLTTFLLDDQIDTGRILLQENMDIGPDETAGELHDRMMDLGAKLVLRTVEGLLNGDILARKQSMPPAGMIYPLAPKLTREMCRIDWNLPARKIQDLVRGLNPLPGAFTFLKRPGEKPVVLKVFKVSIDAGGPDLQPGRVLSEGRQIMYAGTADKPLILLDVQEQGRKRMNIGDYLRGHAINSSCYFDNELLDIL